MSKKNTKSVTPVNKIAKPPVPTRISKDELRTSLASSLDPIRDHRDAFEKMMIGLQNTLRPEADVSLSTIEDVNAAIKTAEACKKSMLSIRNNLKLRAKTRLQEVG